MNIVFNSLTLHNFLSFEDATINLNYSGYTLIQGINNNIIDNAKSNGSGKSALLEGIIWALTGETIRGSKSVCRLNVSDDDKKCYVALNFKVDNDNYEICRQLNPSNLKIKVNNEDISGKGIRDSSKILVERLPELNSYLLGSVVLLGQGLPQRFTNNTPSGRKDILEKLFKSDFMIQDLKNKISDRKKYLDSVINKLNALDIEYNTELKIFESSLARNVDKLNNIKDTSILIEKLESVQNNIDDYKLKLNTLILDLNTYKQDFNICMDDKFTYTSKLADLVQSESKIFDLALSDYKVKIDSLNLDIHSLESEITKINNIKDVCPTCGQKIPGVAKPTTKNLEESLNSKKTELAKILDEFNDTNNHKNIKISELKSNHDNEIRLIDNKITDINNKIKITESKITELNTNIKVFEDEKIKLKIELDNNESNRQEIKKAIDELKIDIDNLNSKILYNNKEKENYTCRLDYIQKMSNIVTKDFRGYLLSSIIRFIDDKCKEYSVEVFNNNKIDFILDGNNINITFDNKDYENLSGGERQKLDLIIQFSIRDLLCKYLNFSSNILVIDELFDNLDSTGCEKVLNLISKKLIDIEHVYIITHHTSIPIPFDDIITVIKNENGISYIDDI